MSPSRLSAQLEIGYQHNNAAKYGLIIVINKIPEMYRDNCQNRTPLIYLIDTYWLLKYNNIFDASFFLKMA